MRIATVAEVKNGLSRYLARARKRREPIMVTHHGKPHALIQPLSERDLEMLDWKRLAERRLRGAVVVVDVAFSDLSGSKRRPALVVSDEAFHRTLPDLIVCPISTRTSFGERWACCGRRIS